MPNSNIEILQVGGLLKPEHAGEFVEQLRKSEVLFGSGSGSLCQNIPPNMKPIHEIQGVSDLAICCNELTLSGDAESLDAVEKFADSIELSWMRRSGALLRWCVYLKTPKTVTRSVLAGHLTLVVSDSGDYSPAVPVKAVRRIVDECLANIANGPEMSASDALRWVYEQLKSLCGPAAVVPALAVVDRYYVEHKSSLVGPFWDEESAHKWSSEHPKSRLVPILLESGTVFQSMRKSISKVSTSIEACMSETEDSK